MDVGNKFYSILFYNHIEVLEHLVAHPYEPLVLYARGVLNDRDNNGHIS